MDWGKCKRNKGLQDFSVCHFTLFSAGFELVERELTKRSAYFVLRNQKELRNTQYGIRLIPANSQEAHCFFTGQQKGQAKGKGDTNEMAPNKAAAEGIEAKMTVDEDRQLGGE
jgi:hypothetical protein